MTLSLAPLGLWELFILLAAAGSISYAAVHRFLLHQSSRSRLSSPTPEKPLVTSKPTRQPGVWKPVDFTMPLPPPYPDFSIKDTKPLPYRPFRHGPKYFITMGLRKVNFEDWIEIDNEWPKYHSLKLERIAGPRGPKTVQTLPTAYPAAIELMEELARYLPERYPSLFRTTDVGIDNLYTGESFNIKERPLKEDPMQIAAKWIQDDLTIMTEGPDGKYYLTAGATLLPGFWRLEDKVGMSLDEIHTSGHVPGYQTKLQKGMNHFFERVQPDSMVARNNYFIQTDPNLAWSSTIGTEDLPASKFGWFTSTTTPKIEDIYYRSERQTLRRLPKSGGVVFTIRTYFIPVTKMTDEPYVPGRLASGIKSWDEDVAKYKGRARWGDVLIPWLEEQHRRQMEGGLREEDEELVFKYPYQSGLQ